MGLGEILVLVVRVLDVLLGLVGGGVENSDVVSWGRRRGVVEGVWGIGFVVGLRSRGIPAGLHSRVVRVFGNWAVGGREFVGEDRVRELQLEFAGCVTPEVLAVARNYLV